MKAIEVENQLREVVGRLITEVDLATSQGRLDVNLVSEDAWIPILRDVFQCPGLINLNKKQKNFPGIDLGDEQDRVAFQITASTDLKKVKKTLSQFRDKNYKNSFDELHILTLTRKQSSYSQDAIDKEIQGEFTFSAKKNIIDPGDVLQRITSMRLGAQERLLNEFRIILGDIKDRLAASEVADQPPLMFASNLVAMDFPQRIYIAELDIDCKSIATKARNHLGYKKSKLGKALAVRLLLVLNSVERHDWVVHDNKLFTFEELNSESDFASVVDIGSVDPLESEEFFDSELLEYRNLFMRLLKNTAMDMLEPYNVKWHKKEKTFYFRPLDDEQPVRQEKWVGKQSATRTVCQIRYQKKDPSKISYYKHLSFDLAFLKIEERCYCTVYTSWLYTRDAYRVSFYQQDLLSKQKRLELNASVRNHIRFVAYYLENLEMRSVSDLCFYSLVELECPNSLSSKSEDMELESPEETNDES